METDINVQKPTGRTWKMWAHTYDRDGKFIFRHISISRLCVEQYGISAPIVPVEVSESNTGDHFGWIETGSDYPVMIYPNKIFDWYFHNGSKMEVEKRQGIIIKLEIKSI